MNFPNLSFLIVIFLALLQATDAVRQSLGCSKNRRRRFRPGRTTTIKRKVPGTQRRMHSITLPRNYRQNNETPPPLVFYFHGWSGDHRECGSGCTVIPKKEKYSFLTVSMTGYGEYYAHYSMHFSNGHHHSLMKLKSIN